MAAQKNDFKSDGRIILEQVLSYFLAGINGLLGLVNVIMLRETVTTLLPLSGIHVEAWKSVDILTFILFGICWLILVLYCQYYYEQGDILKYVWQKFARITGLQFLLLFVTHGIQVLVIGAGASWFTALLLGVEILGAVVLLVLGLLKKKTAKTSDRRTNRLIGK